MIVVTGDDDEIDHETRLIVVTELGDHLDHLLGVIEHFKP
jgi:hypothetical protein